MKLGTWNVRTVFQGVLDQDITNSNTIRKTSIMDRELSLLNVDTAALQETR